MQIPAGECSDVEKVAEIMEELFENYDDKDRKAPATLFISFSLSDDKKVNKNISLH